MNDTVPPPKPAPSWPQDAPPLRTELLGPDGMGTPSRAQIEAAYGVDQPAPDAIAMRSALRWRASAYRSQGGRLFDGWTVANDFDAYADAAVPVSPADGARIQRLEQTIRDSIEALERNSTSAPVVECLKAALSPSPAIDKTAAAQITKEAAEAASKRAT